tara:strand:+ start:16529 stop:16738 length:210 start_codon:yes stop_codon:yes gene_type:complete
MQTIDNPNLSRLTREGAVGIALISAVALGCVVCPYAGFLGIAGLAIWGHKLADASESFVARRLKRTSVA